MACFFLLPSPSLDERGAEATHRVRTTNQPERKIEMKDKIEEKSKRLDTLFERFLPIGSAAERDRCYELIMRKRLTNEDIAIILRTIRFLDDEE